MKKGKEESGVITKKICAFISLLLIISLVAGDAGRCAFALAPRSEVPDKQTQIEAKVNALDLLLKDAFSPAPGKKGRYLEAARDVLKLYGHEGWYAYRQVDGSDGMIVRLVIDIGDGCEVSYFVQRGKVSRTIVRTDIKQAAPAEKPQKAVGFSSAAITAAKMASIFFAVVFGWEMIENYLSAGAVNYSAHLIEGALAVIVFYLLTYRLAMKDRRTAAIFETSRSPMLLMERDGTVSLTNEAFERMSGYKRKDVDGKMNVFSIIPEREKARLAAYHRRRLANPDNTPRTYVAAILDATGVEREMIMNVDLLPGSTTAIISAIDLSDVRNLEQRYAQTQEQEKAILSALPVLCFKIDPSGMINWFSSAEKSDIYAPPEQFLNKNISEVLPPAQAAQLRTAMDECMSTRKLTSVEYSLLMPQGQQWYQARFSPISDGVIVVVSNISDLKKTQDRIAESERRFRDTIEKINLVGVQLDRDGRITFCNDHLLELTGWKREEVLGKDWFETFLPGSMRGDLRQDFDKSLQTGQPMPVHYDNVIITRTGKELLISWTNTPLYDTRNRLMGFSSIGKDITAQRRYEDELVAAARAWEDTFNSMTDGVSIHGDDYTILNANEAFCRVLGKSKEEIVGRKCFYMFHGAGSPLDGCPLEKVMKTGNRQYVEVFEPSLNKWLAVSVASVRDREGVTKYVHVVRDFTERKEMEMELNESHVLFANLAEQVPGGLYQFKMSPDGTFSIPFASKNFAYNFDLAPELLQTDATALFTRIHPEDVAGVVAAIQESGRSLTVYNQEFRVVLPGKGIRWQYAQSRPEKLPDGSVLWHGFVMDITEKKKTEEVIRASEKSLREILNAAQESVLMFTPDGTVLEINDNALALFGKTREELLGKVLFDMFPREIAERRRKGLETILRNKKSVVMQDEHGGKIFRLNIVPILNEDGEIEKIVQFAVDITAIVQAERELRHSARFLQDTINAIPSPVMVKNKEGRFMLCNTAYLNLFDIGPEKVIGKTPEEFYPNKGEAAKYREMDLRVLSGTDKEQVYEHTMTGADGRPRNMIFYKAPLFGEKGDINGLVGVIIDITDRKKMEQALADAQKLAAIGQLAAGVAHEINNPVGVIQGLLEQLKGAEAGTPPHGDARILIEKAQKETARVATIVSELLTYSRQRKLALEPVDLEAAVREALEKTKGVVSGCGVDVRVLCPAPLTAQADPAKLQQVLINLITNACHAMDGRDVRKLEIAISKNERAMAVIKVKDTGTGMTKEVLDKIYEPFFTTKKEGGTGLGVPIVQSIVREHGGTVRIRSVFGKGTTFTVALPIGAVAAGKKSAAPAESEVPLRKIGKVLVMDDEEGIRSNWLAFLKRAGIAAMAASNMEEALAAIQKEEFDAVISDITVKRGVKTQAEEQAEGYIFAVKARQAGYKGPIALCTGYGADHPDLQKLVSAGVATMGVSKTDVFTDVPGLIGRLESVVVSETPADTLAKYAGAVGRGDMTVFSGGNEAKGPAAPPAGLLQQAETLLRATRHEVNNKINGLSYLGLLSEMMSDGGPTRENDGLRGLLRAMNVISERCLAINDRVNGIPKKITTADEAAAGLRTMIDGYEEMSLLIEQTAARTAELEALLERNDGTRQYVKQARGILQVNEAKQVIDSSIPAADKLFAEIRGTAGLPRGISIFNERIRHDINNKISGMGDLYLLRGDISERRVPDGDGTIARVAADIENVYEELVVLQKSIMEIPKVVPGQADARDTIRSAAEKYAAVKLILAQIQEKSRHLLGLMQTAQYPDRDKYFRTLFENMDRMISETAVLIDHFIWSAQQKLGAAAPATVAADGAGKAVEEKPAREEARAPVGKEPAVLRILVVDDEEQLRKMLEMQLNMAGHIVTGVPGSADALAKVGAGEVFDVMIVDATLGPSESGFELIRKLREIERDAGSHSFIVGISGNENADQFSVAGADRFLHKPFMRADLKSALADAAPAAVVEAGAKVSPEKPVREKAPVPVEKQPAGLRILVVDDEAGNRESLDFALGMAGHAVTGAASAPEALARIDAGEKFDIIMIDVNLGVGGNGIKLIRKIREIERRAGGRQSFIIALSGDDASALCVEAGANRFFPKPAEIRSLIELIEKSVPVRAAPLPPLIKSGEETDSYDKGKKESLDPAA